MADQPRLPADIISRILYESDQPRSMIPRYSKGILERSRGYIKEECNHPVFEKELEDYLDKTSSIILFQYEIYPRKGNGITDNSESENDIGAEAENEEEEEENDINKSIINTYSLTYIKIAGNWFYTSIILSTDEGRLDYITYKTEGSKSTIDILDRIFRPKFWNKAVKILDVVTLYNIYKNRLNCMRISSAFAKDLVIDNFMKVISDIEAIDVDRDFLVIYLYLYTQASTLGITSKLLPLKNIKLVDEDFFSPIRDDQFNKPSIKRYYS